MDHMAELKARVQGILLENEPMSKHTSYGIGGPAWAYITPKDKNDLGNILHFASAGEIQVHFVGSGSNLLVADEGIDGIVINDLDTSKDSYYNYNYYNYNYSSGYYNKA